MITPRTADAVWSPLERSELYRGSHGQPPCLSRSFAASIRPYTTAMRSLTEDCAVRINGRLKAVFV